MNQVTTNVRKNIIKLVILLVVITILSQCTSPKKQTVEESEYKKDLSEKLF